MNKDQSLYDVIDQSLYDVIDKSLGLHGGSPPMPLWPEVVWHDGMLRLKAMVGVRTKSRRKDRMQKLPL